MHINRPLNRAAGSDVIQLNFSSSLGRWQGEVVAKAMLLSSRMWNKRQYWDANKIHQVKRQEYTEIVAPTQAIMAS
jgi:hypothetical protein